MTTSDFNFVNEGQNSFDNLILHLVMSSSSYELFSVPDKQIKISIEEQTRKSYIRKESDNERPGPSRNGHGHGGGQRQESDSESKGKTQETDSSQLSQREKERKREKPGREAEVNNQSQRSKIEKERL